MQRSFRLLSALVLSAGAVVAAGCALSSSPGDDDDDDDDGRAGNAQAGSSAGTGSPAAGSGGTGAAGTPGAGSGGASGAGGSLGGSSFGGAGSGGAPASGGAAGTGGSAGTMGQAGAGAGGSAGSSGAAGSAGSAGVAGSGQAGSAGASGSGGGTGSGALGDGMHEGMGKSSERYETVEVKRNGTPYILITNGWGPGFGSHTVSWNGTSFNVEAMMGSPGSSGQPASYPSVFCGRYSVMQVPDCGLPAALDTIQTLKTGWRWSANGNMTDYNAAYDIWLGNGSMFTMYLMVWLRDPPGQQPAGSPHPDHQGVTVANVPGVWNIWTGTVNNRPIINWVRPENMDSPEIEFDLMDFIRDGQMRGLNVMGTHVNAVAVGFEIWEGPVTNLVSDDFYVTVN